MCYDLSHGSGTSSNEQNFKHLGKMADRDKGGIR